MFEQSNTHYVSTMKTRYWATHMHPIGCNGDMEQSLLEIWYSDFFPIWNIHACGPLCHPVIRFEQHTSLLKFWAEHEESHKSSCRLPLRLPMMLSELHLIMGSMKNSTAGVVKISTLFAIRIFPLKRHYLTGFTYLQHHQFSEDTTLKISQVILMQVQGTHSSLRGK